MRRRQQSTHFSEILARIEKSKKHEDDERVGSFSKNSRMLASFGGGLGAGFGMDAIGNEGGMPVNAVLKEVSALKKGQEDEAKRSRDRSEAISKLELHCGVLEDKLAAKTEPYLATASHSTPVSAAPTSRLPVV